MGWIEVAENGIEKYRIATRMKSTAEYTSLNLVKYRIKKAQTNLDILRDVRQVFVIAIRYYWDPANPFRRFAWGMLSELDGAIFRNNHLLTSLAQEGLRFRPFGRAFPGAAPVFKVMELVFYKNNRNDAYFLYYNDGFYHPEDNFEDPDDYKTYVKEPRFLCDIFTNLAERVYKSFDEVYKDVMLVFQNAMSYFKDEDGKFLENGERALRLHESFTKAWNDALPAIRAAAEVDFQDNGPQSSTPLFSPLSIVNSPSPLSRSSGQPTTSVPGVKFKFSIKSSTNSNDAASTSSSSLSTSRTQFADTQSQIPNLPVPTLSSVPVFAPFVAPTALSSSHLDPEGSSLSQSLLQDSFSSSQPQKTKLKIKFTSSASSSSIFAHPVSSNTLQEPVQLSSSVHNTRHSHIERASSPPAKRQKVHSYEIPTTQEEIIARMHILVKKLQSGVKVTRPSATVHAKGRKSGADLVNITTEFELDPTPVAPLDYTTRVTRPMWLQRVASNLKIGLYATPDDLRRDLDLIGTNCLLYNAGQIEWEWRAKEWLKYVDRHFRRLFLGEKGSTRQPTSSFVNTASKDGGEFGAGSEDKEATEQSETDSDAMSISDMTIGESADQVISTITSSSTATLSTAMEVVKTYLPSQQPSFELALGSAAPQFADVDMDANLPRMFLFDSLFDDYDIIRDRSPHHTVSSSRLVSSRNENLEQGVRPLCESLVRRIRKTTVVRRVVDQLKRAHNDPRYAAVANKLVLPESMKRDETVEFEEDEADDNSGQYGQVLAFTSFTKISTIGRIQARLQATSEQAAADSKFGDRIQRSVHLQMLRSLPPPYRTVGSLFRDLFGMFEVAVRIHSREAWEEAGVCALHDESIEQRSSLATIALEFVKALSNEYFAHIVKEEAAKQEQMRLDARQFVEPALVSVSSRASLLEAIKMMTSNPYLKDCAKHFSRPVQLLFPHLPPLYWKLIARPIDFGTIEERLLSDKEVDDDVLGALPVSNSVSSSSNTSTGPFYKNHAEFSADVEQTLSNAIVYNSRSTGDKNIAIAAKTLQREWREVVWPECCVYSRLALRNDVVEASALRRAQEKDERLQNDARKKLEALALVNGAASVIRDADVWIDRAVNAVATGHLEDVPVDISLFATSASGGLNRNSAIAMFAARNIDEEPARAAAIIANELREAELREAEAKSKTQRITTKETTTQLVSSQVIRALMASKPREQGLVVGHRERLLMQREPLTSEKRTLLVNAAEAAAAPGTRSFFLLRQLGLV